MDDPRIIILSGEVNERSALDVIVRLMSFDNEDHKSEISLYINSPGGSIDYGLAIYDVIRHIEAPVSTVCFGMAASMGAFLLSCGQPGRRFALPHSRVLIHQLLINTRSGSYKSETAMRKMADNILASRSELERIIAENVGKTPEEVHIDCERDNWMSAQQAKDYGIIDDILCL